MRDALREALTTQEKGPKVLIAQSRVHAQPAAPREAAGAGKAVAAGERVVRERFGVDSDTCTGDHSCIRLVGLPVAVDQAEPRSAAHRPGRDRARQLRRLRRLRRGLARGGAVPVVLQGADRQQPDALGPAARARARRRDRLAAARATRAGASASRSDGASHEQRNRSRSRSSPWAARAAACSPTGSSTSASTTATSRRRPRCPASPSAPARRSTTSSSIPQRAGRAPTAAQPVLALMPLPGDVDVVLASELMEAGRAVQRGLVTPDRTTLIASTHRVYSIAEKIGARRRPRRQRRAARACRSGGQALRPLRHGAGRRARRAASSARCCSARSPAPACCRSRARSSRRRSSAAASASKPSLTAFAAGFARARRRRRRRPRRRARRASLAAPAARRSTARPMRRPRRRRASRRPRARRAIRAVRALLERVRSDFPAAAQPMLIEGVRRLIDYQDPAYAALYLDRLARIRAAGRPTPTLLARDRAPPRAVDVVRGHDPRRRPEDARLRASSACAARCASSGDQVLAINEYMHPRAAGDLRDAAGRRSAAGC